MDQISNFTNFILIFSNFQEDLSGAAAAIFRLQDVYRLSTKDLANGKIYNIDSNQTLSG